ncbi:MAG: N-acetyltransferase [Chloroflexi bacterium]|nr:MAG: N-acetyltransferase [Chloroflexota bacterium]
MKPVIRLLQSADISEIAAAFRQLGWNKPASQYERYLLEQEQKVREVYVAFVQAKFAGYLTICWTSNYEPFRESHIPEIVDFNVLPDFRRQGIGTQLMDKAESEIASVSPMAGIGVGVTADYGAAQKLYILRGYIPDGRGLRYRDHPVRYGEEVRVDDDLVLYFTKNLKQV